MGGLLGGPKGMLAPPSQIIGGPGPPWPPPLFLRLCNLHYIKLFTIRLFISFDDEKFYIETNGNYRPTSLTHSENTVSLKYISGDKAHKSIIHFIKENFGIRLHHIYMHATL